MENKTKFAIFGVALLLLVAGVFSAYSLSGSQKETTNAVQSTPTLAAKTCGCSAGTNTNTCSCGSEGGCGCGGSCGGSCGCATKTI